MRPRSASRRARWRSFSADVVPRQPAPAWSTVTSTGATSDEGLLPPGQPERCRSHRPPPWRAPGGSQLAEFDRGRTVAAQAGCPACHRIGGQGSPAPGFDLTHIGSMLPTRVSERVLIEPLRCRPLRISRERASGRSSGSSRRCDARDVLGASCHADARWLAIDDRH